MIERSRSSLAGFWGVGRALKQRWWGFAWGMSAAQCRWGLDGSNALTESKSGLLSEELWRPRVA